MRKQENVTHERKQSIEGHWEMAQMLDLPDMDFKIAMINT